MEFLKPKRKTIMEMAKFNREYRTDQQLEVKGVEVHIGEGFYIRVARAGNPVAKKLFDELMSDPKVDMERRAGALSADKIEEIVLDVNSRAILVGWRGLTDNNVDVPYTVEKARELLRCADFRDRVIDIARTQANYRAIAVETATDTLGKG